MTQEIKKSLNVADVGLKGIRLTLIKETAYTREKNKKVEVKDPNGEPRYVRNDIFGLMGLLSKFDSKIHTMKDYKQWIKVKDKLTVCFLNNSDVLELSLDEAAFLKEYLTNLTAKDAKEVSLIEFEIRSLVGALEQFEEK